MKHTSIKVISERHVFFIAVFFILLSQNPTLAQNDTIFVKGKVIDTVKCLQNPLFSYALYLPGCFNTAKKWPVIYLHDPMARGTLAVNKFVPVAEKYGYILVCSNNSRNGSMEKSIEAYSITFEDTGNRLPIDFTRIYISGFSGGSRVASFIANNSKNISGVIGCGAGYPSRKESLLSEQPSFVYVGIVGTRDMNYFEMFAYEHDLLSKGLTVNLLTNKSKHEWPPDPSLHESIEWLELQAMRKGKVLKNDSFVRAQFEKLVQKVKKLHGQHDLFEVARLVKYMIRDYPDQPEIFVYQHVLDSLVATKDYKKAIKEREKIKMLETSNREVLDKSFNTIIFNGMLSDSVRTCWNSMLRNLKKMENRHDLNEQWMASRLINMLEVKFYEAGTYYMNSNQYRLAAVTYELGTIVQQQNMYAFYRLARAYALGNEPKKSLNALDKAITMGLKDKHMLQNDVAFIQLKDEKRFKTLLAKLRD